MFQNEKGGALLIVLIMMVFFVIIGMTLLSRNLTANKQFTSKEEQVQARHLAEMGVQYYKAVLNRKLVKFNNDKSFIVYKDKLIDHQKSLLNYKSRLCNLVTEIPLALHESETGRYKLESTITCEDDKIKIDLNSIGKVNGTDKQVSALLLISSESENDSVDNDELVREVPNKPISPASMKQVFTLDEIGNASAVSVIHGITNQNPFTTNAFIELLGSLDMQKKSDWTFNDHLVVNGSMAMKTAGANISELKVKKGLYIGGALHTANHNIIKIDGDLTIRGNVEIGTKSEILVRGNALFSSVVEVVDTHAQVTIGQDAYFMHPVKNVKNKASLCVKGSPYLWKNNEWVSYSPSDNGYHYFDLTCLGTASPNNGNVADSYGSYNWVLQPGLNIQYK